MSKRLDREGFSFFTKTLPALGKAIDMALSGCGPLTTPGFRKIPGTQLPMLMGWLFDRVFTGNGDVRSDADAVALKHLRQIVYFVYKLQVPYADKLQNEVISAFIHVDESLSTLELDSANSVLKKSRAIIARLFDGFDARDIIPRHGPGSVSTGEEVGEKSNFSRIFRSAEQYYPFTGYFALGTSHLCDRRDWLESLDVQETGTAKVVLVPKDSRGPRLISCEPLELQWLQQGLLRKITPWVERHRLTRGHVNFTDQTINRRLALEGSLTGEWVTLDMKDASDRVSLSLVKELFSGTTLLEALLATRSGQTRLANGTLVTLNKFAPMGSAVCFPVEAICFWALAYGILVCNGRKSRYARDSIFVYGDDIIMRREDYALVLQHFPTFGLMFNSRKCCVAGSFRESCGCDAFRGIDVTPIRMRTTWSHHGCKNATELLSYVELSNRLHEHGYLGTADSIKNLVEDKYDLLPMIPDQRLAERVCPPFLKMLSESISGIEDKDDEESTSSPSRGLIAWVRPETDHRRYNIVNKVYRRFSAVFHVMMLRSWVIRPVFKKYRNLDGWQECLRSINCGSTGLESGVYALPRRTRLKRGWLAAYSY